MQAFELIVCVQADDIVARPIDTTAKTFLILLITNTTLHDLRRTFVTGMVELHVPPHVVELVVNHISGTRAGVAVQPLRAASRTQGGARTLGDARARPRGALAGQRG